MGKGDVNMPDERSYAGETASALKAQVKLAPRLYGAEAQYRPLYNQLDLSSINTMLTGGGGQPGLLSLYQNQIAPTLSAIDQQSLATQRGADISDVARLGPQATQAILNANPQNAALVNELNRQAQAELALGGQLTPDQIRQMQQASRAGYAARGLSQSNAAIADEVIRQYQLSGAEQARRRAFAAGIVGMNQQVTGDPFQAILGRPSQVLGMTPGVASNAYGMTQNIGPQLFNPESQYNADVYGQRYMSQLQANTSAAANRTAMAGALIGAAGQAASAL